MTVADLIDKLSEYDSDTLVCLRVGRGSLEDATRIGINEIGKSTPQGFVRLKILVIEAESKE